MSYRTERAFTAPIDAVWEMITDPDAQVTMLERMGYRDIEVVEHRLDGADFRIVTRRTLTLDLPGFARRVLRPTNTMDSTDEWHRGADGSATGSISMTIEGAPVAITGSASINPDGDSTCYAITIDIDVRVPVIGGKIARWAMRDVERQFTRQFEAVDEWLTSHES